jgi:hypothetical protein
MMDACRVRGGGGLVVILRRMVEKVKQGSKNGGGWEACIEDMEVVEMEGD